MIKYKEDNIYKPLQKGHNFCKICVREKRAAVRCTAANLILHFAPQAQALLQEQCFFPVFFLLLDRSGFRRFSTMWIRIRSTDHHIYIGHKQVLQSKFVHIYPFFWRWFESRLKCWTVQAAEVLAPVLHIGWVNMFQIFKFFNAFIVRQAHLRPKVPKQANFRRSWQNSHAEI